MSATPLTSVTGPPAGDPSISNWTVPVGIVAAVAPMTAALNVTCWPVTSPLGARYTRTLVSLPEGAPSVTLSTTGPHAPPSADNATWTEEPAPSTSRWAL